MLFTNRQIVPHISFSSFAYDVRVDEMTISLDDGLSSEIDLLAVILFFFCLT